MAERPCPDSPVTFLVARDRENSPFWAAVRTDLNRGDVHVPNPIRDLAMLHNFAVAWRPTGMAYATLLTVGYMVSGGLAKSGSRDPYDADDAGR
jgi:hypothetical protein